MNKLNESLRPLDLEGLVLPVISIDEYESKISSDDHVVVLAFFVNDEEPANDLSRFIDKSSYEIIDTEVSEAPDEDGNYLVFVEIYRNSKLPKLVLDIVNEVENLTGKQDWKFIAYKRAIRFDLSIENLSSIIELNSIRVENISDFFKDALVEKISTDGNNIIFEKAKLEQRYKIIEFPIFEKDKILKENFKINESTFSLTKQLNSYFGTQYTIDVLGDNVLISNNKLDYSILLTKQ